MKLQILIGIENEVQTVLERYQNDFSVVIMKDEADLITGLSEERQACENMLLIAATDTTIALGRQYAVATMAYMNPQIPGQTYSGVDMIVEGFEEVDAGFLEKVYQRYHHIPWQIATTKRTIIRELSMDDLDALFALYKDEKLLEFMEDLYPYEEEKAFQQAYIENMYRFYGYGMWLVFSKETGELLGRAGLEHREYNGETELELGYLIGTKYQGQGYATEACDAILRIAKEITDFPRINCLIDAKNVSSIRLAEKLGFSHIEDMKMNGRKMSRYILAL